ncbi:MAG: hypothetical protein WD768_17375 [Phycisphaeraceae bacterium]
MERLLGAILEQSEFELIRFKNQPSKGGTGVPDGIIQSSLRVLLETKAVRGGVGTAQLERHRDRLNSASEAVKILLVLTPDAERPLAVDQMNDHRVVWASFARVDQAIDEILEDKYEVISEREAYLLRELQSMFTAEGLLGNTSDVVIVAARNAWPEYNELHAYVCQPNRTFQRVSRMGFYSAGVIYACVPKIRESYDEVEMRIDAHKGDLGKLVNRLVKEGRRPEGVMNKVMLLSSPDSSDTLKLTRPIPNDKRSKTGKPTAFTMGQRYVSSDILVRAETTTDLD